MNKTTFIVFQVVLAFCAQVVFAESVLDEIQFGNKKSEQAHKFDGGQSETIAGGLGVSARRILPR